MARHEALACADYDLVCTWFVLHWVDRRSLLASLANIDKHVADGGFVAIGDFRIDYPQRRRYHHLQDEAVYTWKADYAGMLLATGMYRRVHYQLLDYPGCHTLAPELGDQSRACVSILQRLRVEDIAEV